MQIIVNFMDEFKVYNLEVLLKIKRKLKEQLKAMSCQND